MSWRPQVRSLQMHEIKAKTTSFSILAPLRKDNVSYLLRGHSSYINCVAMHDTFVITGGADSTIRK